jgi:tryptophan-rich sensory protein
MKTLAFKLVVSITLCLVLGILSGVRTSDSIQTWYLLLNKPSWNPPNWLFGPVWSVLYIAMGVSISLVWHSNSPLKLQAFLIFLAQFFLNMAWSEIFFVQKSIGFALAEMIVMWITILLCIRQFHPINPWASYLLIPYLAWVGFATFLTFTIWRLNPGI